ncbi:MAG: CDP-glycerol glycerophosphotransferase family protein [Bacteroidetes bacterium]|nr:CDP-glycerol glycerophosphotransferase family protein [Bacteroidota bacterium]
MSYKKIGDSHSKYLAATDILIGDMSDINYEFLLFNRPIILLANQWLRDNFPDIGIKTDIDGLEKAIQRSIEQPDEFEEEIKLWLRKTMHKPDGKSSQRVLDIIIKKSGIINPEIVLVHGGINVISHFLIPLHREAKKRNINSKLVNTIRKNDHNNNIIYISAHNDSLSVPFGYKVHIDHGLKGVGVTDFQQQIVQYKNKHYYMHTDLHITEGKISYEKTQKLLGPYSDRALMVGFPKSDILIQLNTVENKEAVCIELGFDPCIPLVTYAPAGKYKYPFKQGASLSNRVINKLKKISKSQDFNILVKLKYPRKLIFQRVINKIKSSL